MTVTSGFSAIASIDGGAGGVGVGFGASALERQDGALGANLLEDRRRVIGDRVFARLRDAVALLSQHVQQDRALLVLDVAQPAPQGRQVVPVDGSDVAEAELLEEHSAREEGLQAVAHLVDGLVGHAADERKLADDVLHMTLGVLVETGKSGPVEATGQSADSRTDGHLVVVENDEQVLAQAAGVVESLEDDSRRQGAVADDRDRVVVALAEKLVADLEAQRTRDAAAGVAGHEQVVSALVGIGITHEAAARADGVEIRIAARDQLVRINLVAGVPDEAVLAEIEGQVQGQAQLDDAQVAGEVSGANAQHAHQLVAHLLGQLDQLLIAERLQICGRLNLFQEGAHRLFPCVGKKEE